MSARFFASWVGFGFIALAACAASARAVDKTYIGGPGTGTWSVGSFWSPFGQPQNFDNVLLVPSDANGRLVVFDGAGSLAFDYGSVTIQPGGPGTMGLLNAGAFFAAQSIAVHDRGEYRTTANAARTVVGSVVVGGGTFAHNLGTLTATHVTQTGGVVQLNHATLNGGYLLEGGVVSMNRLVNNGSFGFHGGFVASGIIENHGTIAYRAASGPLLAEVENHGTVVLDVAVATFGSLTNHVPFTLPADRAMTAASLLGVRQTTGTFLHLGSLSTPRAYVQNATWDQRSGRLAIIGTGADLVVGTSDAMVAQPGTFLLSGGTVTTFIGAQISVPASFSHGTFAQSGGTVGSGTLLVGAAVESRGTFALSAGSLVVGLMQVGNATFDGVGTFVQSGGAAKVGTLTNFATARITGGAFNATRVNNHAVLAQTGGVAEVMRLEGAGDLNVAGGGSLNIGSLDQAVVRLSGGGRIAAAPDAIGGTRTSRVNVLEFEDVAGGGVQGTWDLGPGALIVNYVGASPIDTLRRYLRAGYANGSWNGTGLSSSTAAASPGKALAYAEARDAIGEFGGNFEGVFADATSVVIGLRRYGDANLDGAVNLQDFNRLAGNFGGANRTWYQGDFNYDGAVNLQDFNRLAANFGLSATGPDVTAADWAALASAVPEPSVAPVAMILLLRGRRRNLRFRGALKFAEVHLTCAGNRRAQSSSLPSSLVSCSRWSAAPLRSRRRRASRGSA